MGAGASDGGGRYAPGPSAAPNEVPSVPSRSSPPSRTPPLVRRPSSGSEVNVQFQGIPGDDEGRRRQGKALQRLVGTALAGGDTAQLRHESVLEGVMACLRAEGPQNRPVRLSGIAAAATLAKDAAAARELVARGAVGALLVLTQETTARSEQREESFHALTELTAAGRHAEEAAAAILALGDEYCGYLRKLVDDGTGVEEESAIYKFLANVAACEAGQRALGSRHFIHVIVADVLNPFRQREYKLYPALLLQNLARTAANHGALFADGVVRAIVDMMKNPMAEVRRTGAALLAGLTHTAAGRAECADALPPALALVPDPDGPTAAAALLAARHFARDRGGLRVVGSRIPREALVAAVREPGEAGYASAYFVVCALYRTAEFRPALLELNAEAFIRLATVSGASPELARAGRRALGLPPRPLAELPVVQTLAPAPLPALLQQPAAAMADKRQRWWRAYFLAARSAPPCLRERGAAREELELEADPAPVTARRLVNGLPPASDDGPRPATRRASLLAADAAQAPAEVGPVAAALTGRRPSLRYPSPQPPADEEADAPAPDEATRRQTNFARGRGSVSGPPASFASTADLRRGSVAEEREGRPVSLSHLLAHQRAAAGPVTLGGRSSPAPAGAEGRIRRCSSTVTADGEPPAAGPAASHELPPVPLPRRPSALSPAHARPAAPAALQRSAADRGTPTPPPPAGPSLRASPVFFSSPAFPSSPLARTLGSAASSGPPSPADLSSPLAPPPFFAGPRPAGLPEAVLLPRGSIGSHSYPPPSGPQTLQQLARGPPAAGEVPPLPPAPVPPPLLAVGGRHASPYSAMAQAARWGDGSRAPWDASRYSKFDPGEGGLSEFRQNIRSRRASQSLAPAPAPGPAPSPALAPPLAPLQLPDPPARGATGATWGYAARRASQSAAPPPAPFAQASPTSFPAPAMSAPTSVLPRLPAAAASPADIRRARSEPPAALPVRRLSGGAPASLSQIREHGAGPLLPGPWSPGPGPLLAAVPY